MKMQLFKSHSDLFLSTNIKNVISHINATSEPGTLKSVEQLDRETLIRMDGRLFDLHDLNRYYQNKARNEGFTFGDDLSIRVKGKIVPVVHWQIACHALLITRFVQQRFWQAC